MESSTVSAEKPPAVGREPVTQTAVFEWISRLQAQLHVGPSAGLLDFDGIELTDVLITPLFLAVLNAARGGVERRASGPRGLYMRARRWAYEAREVYRQRVAAKGAAAAEPADVVLWPREVTHVAVFRELARALAEQEIRHRFLTCQVKTCQALRQIDPTTVFAHAAWPATIREARREGARRARQLSAAEPWQLPGLGTLSGAELEGVARDTLVEFLPAAIEAIATADAALATLRPKVLVVGNDLTIEGRAACRVAAARGVPTAVFMHGCIAAEPLHALHCADRVLVYGPIHREQLIRQGLAAERIVVCGATHLDRLPPQTRVPHPVLRERLGLEEGQPWVLVATSGPGHSISHAHHQQVIAAICQLARAMSPVPIVVKLHRKDRLEHYRAQIERAGAKNLHVIDDAAAKAGYPATIFDWLQGCSVVLTGASTVAIEAMAMDVPVVTMDFCDEIQGVDFIEAGATVHARTAEKLQGAVRQILAERGHRADVQANVQSHLRRSFHALDGGSARRGVEAILELMTETGAQ